MTSWPILKAVINTLDKKTIQDTSVEIINKFDIEGVDFFSSDLVYLAGQNEDGVEHDGHSDREYKLYLQKISRGVIQPKIIQKSESIFYVFGHPIVEDGTIKGYIVILNKLNSKFINEIFLGSNIGVNFIINNQSIATSDPSIKWPSLNFKYLINETNNKYFYKFPLTNYREDLKVILSIDKYYFNKLQTNFFKIFIALSFIIVIIFIILSFILANIISQPILNLRKFTLHLIKDWNLSDRIYLRQNKELGELSSAINSLVVEIDTKSKEIEVQQLKAHEAAQLASLGEMAAGIAHEINNPLAVIQGRIEILARKMKEKSLTFEEVQSSLIKLEKMTNRITKIILGLLRFSRKERVNKFEKINIYEVLTDVIDISQGKFIKHGTLLDVKTNVNLELNGIINGNEVQLSQVFFNLLNNSFDAVSELEDKWVRVEIDLEDDKILIRFIDSGGGISPELESKIMGAFFTTKPAGKGTGLGLSISKGIIESHQGQLTIDRNFKNTCFLITLPLA